MMNLITHLSSLDSYLGSLSLNRQEHTKVMHLTTALRTAILEEIQKQASETKKPDLPLQVQNS